MVGTPLRLLYIVRSVASDCHKNKSMIFPKMRCILLFDIKHTQSREVVSEEILFILFIFSKK